MGIYLSLKIFNFPDITTDGSYTLGAAITGIMLSHNLNFWLALVVSFFGAALAGSITGLIATKLKVNSLLAGILVMTALYSVNISLMGRSNIPLTMGSTIFNALHFAGRYQPVIILVLFIAIIWTLLSLLLKTDFGLAMRATGSNEQMVRSMGVNTDTMKIIGLALANGLIGLSGFLISQFQGFVDINMGIGIIVTGLGSVLIGESLLDLFNVQSIAYRLLGVILGSVIFQLLLALALDAGLDANLLKLFTAFLVLVVVSIPGIKYKIR